MANKDSKEYIHPYIAAKPRIQEEKVIIIDNVTEVPLYNQACISNDFLIFICHKGENWEETCNLKAKGVAIATPKQIVRSYKSSNDFLQTIIAVSNDFYTELAQRYPYTRYTSYYRVHPVTLFTDEQFEFILEIVEVLRGLIQHKSKYRSEMILHELSILLNMIGQFRVQNNPEEVIHAPQTMMFNKFYESITEHYHEAHEVAYYAQMFNLTPKYFATIIKEETGISATKWISDYLIIKAKTLIDSRRDLSLQQISMQLGFNDQATFSRYFKAHTGMTATEYRDK